MDKKKRFHKFLLDGGFSFGNEYVKPIWAIQDTEDVENPIIYLEFQDEYQDLCDDIVDFLNNFDTENKKLEDNVYELVEEKLKWYEDLRKQKEEMAEIEFGFNVLKKWYLCPHCSFNSKEFKYLKELRHERDEIC